MTSQLHALSHSSVPSTSTPSSIVVGNGSLLPVTATGLTNLFSSLCLNNVLVSPQLIKNLIQFASLLQITIALWSLTLLVVL